MALHQLAERVLADCRGVVREVRFGFGSKRQLWAFEEDHKVDCAALVRELADSDPAAFLDLAVAFHTEFAAVSGAWRVREAIQSLAAGLCREGGPAFQARIVEQLVDEHLALRHWLVTALLAAPADVSLHGLEAVLERVYQPADQWALLARMQSVAADQERTFGPDATRQLALLAQFCAKPRDRQRALELLARFGTNGASTVLARAARGDAEASVRHRAAELLGS
ncbi:MAG TPA: hypothetical protein VMV93_00255 [Chloroflexota bacterium]|nr:hypothetical protein [Chloroflexota bacterium]